MIPPRVGADKIGGVLQTKIGDLEVDPNGKYNIDCYLRNTPRDDRIALTFHSNHRSEDIEMSMTAAFDPTQAKILSLALQNFIEDTVE